MTTRAKCLPRFLCIAAFVSLGQAACQQLAGIRELPSERNSNDMGGSGGSARDAHASNAGGMGGSAPRPQGDPGGQGGTGGSREEDSQGGTGGSAGEPPTDGASDGSAGDNKLTSKSCADGYETDGSECRDIDECQTQQPCGGHGSCENRPGSYKCDCYAGYSEKDGGCVDVNECEKDQGGCELYCKNVPGSYHCECGDGAYLRPDSQTCWQWHAPVRVESMNDGDATSPCVGVDGSGNATALWLQSDGTHVNVWSNRFTGSWATPERLESDDSGDASNASLTVDDAGHATALWEISIEIDWNRFDAGWGAARQLYRDTLGFDGLRAVSGSRAGTIMVGRSHIFQGVYHHTHRWSGSQWEPSTPIPPAPGDGPQTMSALDLAQGEDERALAVWKQAGSDSARIWASSFAMGTSWQAAPTPLSNLNAASVDSPRVALGGYGTGYAIWTESVALDGGGTGDDKLWTSEYSSLDGWGAGVELSAAPGVAASVRLAADQLSRSVAVWQQTSSGRSGIWAAHYIPYSGRDRDLPQNIEREQTGQAMAPELAMERTSGTTIAVWTVMSDGHSHIWANLYTLDAGWGSAIQLDRDMAGDGSHPRVAIDKNGNAIAIWQQVESGRSDIWAARFD